MSGAGLICKNLWFWGYFEPLLPSSLAQVVSHSIAWGDGVGGSGEYIGAPKLRFTVLVGNGRPTHGVN